MPKRKSKATLRSLLVTPGRFAEYLLKMVRDPAKADVPFAKSGSDISCPIAMFVRDACGADSVGSVYAPLTDSQVLVHIGTKDSFLQRPGEGEQRDRFRYKENEQHLDRQGRWPSLFIKRVDKVHNQGMKMGNNVTPKQALAALCDVKEARKLKLSDEVCCGKETT